MKFRLAPKITEKSQNLSDIANQYMFEIQGDTDVATKSAIKKIIEDNYEVNVTAVRVHNRMGKTKRFGRSARMYKRPDTKVALVSLAAGQSITDFSVLEEETDAD